MRRVVVYELLSLDGIGHDPDEFITDWDEAMDANLAEVISTQDAVILGRLSFEEWADFWPTSDVEPFATFINGVRKYVVTHKPLQREWANSSAVDGRLIDFITDLKKQPGGDIGVHASISVARKLLGMRNVVDELRLVVAPRTVGSDDERVLDSRSLEVEPIRITTSPSGYLLANYRVVRS